MSLSWTAVVGLDRVLPVQRGVTHEEGDMVFAIGISGLQVDEHPEDGRQQLIQPRFCWQGEPWLPLLQVATTFWSCDGPHSVSFGSL